MAFRVFLSDRVAVTLALALFGCPACSSGVRPAGYSNVETAPPRPPRPRPEPSARDQAPEDASPEGELGKPETAAPEPATTTAFARGTTVGAWSASDAGPVALEAVGSGGQWMAVCTPSAVATAHPPMPLDARGRPESPIELTLVTQRGRTKLLAVAAFDETGRWLVGLVPGRSKAGESSPSVLLFDTEHGHTVSLDALSPDIESDGFPDHRSFAFSRDGRHLLVLARSDAGPKGAVGRLLELGQEDAVDKARSIDFGEVAPYRVMTSGDGFAIAILPKQPGPTKWPSAKVESPPLRCQGAILPAFARLSGPQRDPELGWMRLRRGLRQPYAEAAEPAPGYVMGFGDSWVRRTPTGRLLLVGAGQERQIASERCGARILGADETTGWFLIACEEYRPEKPKQDPKAAKKKPVPPKLRFPIYLARPGGLRDLEAETMRTGVDVPAAPLPRYFPLRVGAEAALVDFRAGRLLGLGETTAVLATSDTVVLTRDGDRLFAVQPEPHAPSRAAPAMKSTPIGKAPALARLLLHPGRAAVSNTVYVLEDGTIRSVALTSEPLALTSRVAVTAAKERTHERWAEGPLSLTPLEAALEGRSEATLKSDLASASSESTGTASAP